MIPSIVRNIFEFGYAPNSEQDVSPIISKAIEEQVGLFFPPGHTYWFETPVVVSHASEIKLYGEGHGSRLAARPDLKTSHLFNFQNCNGLELVDLVFEGPGLATPVNGSQSAAVVAAGCVDLEIRRCQFSDFAGNVLYLLSSDGLTVTDNKFSRNEVLVWDSGSVGSGDIVIMGATGQQVDREVIVTRNRCLSNNRLGICLYKMACSAIISNNIVVSRRDEDLREPRLPGEFRRKEGITLGYYCDNETDDPWDVVCTGNIVRNTAWSGIYVAASSESGPYNHDRDGVNAVINSNLVSHACMHVEAKNTPKLQAGLSLRGMRSASVVGNLIHSIDVARTAPVTHAAAGIRVYPSVVASGINQAAITIDGNTVRDVGGKGIELYSYPNPVGHVMIGTNTLVNCDV